MVAAQNRLETTGTFTASLKLFLLIHHAEDSSVVLIGADSISSLCRHADSALLTALSTI